MSRPNDYYEQAVIQIGGFAIFLLIVLILYKYYVDNIEQPVKNNTVYSVQETKVTPVPINTENKVRCLPVNLEHKNDIHSVNKTQFNMYKDGDVTGSDGFYNEVVKPQQQKFAPELEEIYKEASKIHDNTPQQYNSCHIKANKSDLPIANVPLFLLKEDRQPLRLSEKPIVRANI